MTVGVLSDTHGRLYAEVKHALEGADHIIHAGDVGSPQVLQELQGIAPVTAVRGNCDHDSWAQALPLQVEVELAGARILVGHIASLLRGRIEAEEVGAGQADAPAGFAVVVTGHSHLAAMETRGGILRLNPGSAGPLRFGRPRSVARLTIRPAHGGGPGVHAHVEAEIVELDS
ncbi:MAG: metallophosphoesterase family protein [Thermoleophilia bacterium]|nr:metallophosphoesterase family protein [Thermoleophilia bacterium]